MYQNKSTMLHFDISFLPYVPWLLYIMNRKSVFWNSFWWKCIGSLLYHHLYRGCYVSNNVSWSNPYLAVHTATLTGSDPDQADTIHPQNLGTQSRSMGSHPASLIGVAECGQPAHATTTASWVPGQNITQSRCEFVLCVLPQHVSPFNNLKYGLCSRNDPCWT